MAFLLTYTFILGVSFIKILCLRKYKLFIITFCLFSLFLFNYNSERANAVTGFDDAIVFTGATIGTGALIAAIGSCAIAGGVMLDKNYNDGYVCQAIAQRLISSGQQAQYLGTTISDSGKAFLTWTESGLSWVQSQIKDVIASGVPFTNSYTGNVNTVQSFSSPWYVTVHRTTANGTIENFTGSTYSAGSYSFVYDYNPAYTDVGPYILYIFVKGTSTKVLTTYSFASVNFDAYFTGGAVAKAPVSADFSNYSDLTGDLLGSKEIGTDGAISYYPNFGIPLTDTGVNASGSKVYTPDITLPYGKTWGDLDSTLSIPYPDVVPGDTTGDTTGDATGTIGDGILNIPILGDILKALRDILSFLGTLISSLVDAVITALADGLTVAETYFVDNFNDFENRLKDKFPVSLNGLDGLKNVSESNNDFVYNFTLFGVALKIDINFIKKIAPMTRGIISGIVAIWLCWYNYRKIYEVIRGNAPLGGDSSVPPTSPSTSLTIK